MKWLPPMNSIRSQIFALAIGPILIAGAVAALIQPLRTWDDRPPYIGSTVVKIGLVMQQVQAADTPSDRQVVLESTAKAGLRATLVPTSAFSVSSESADIRRAVTDKLREPEPSNSGKPTIFVKLDDTYSLAFPLDPVAAAIWSNNVRWRVTLQLLVAIVPVLLLSIYAGYMITAPLSRFAAAARGLNPLDGAVRPFDERGPREIATLARALNDMRSRMRTMMDDRTRMLRAISHDLRTPLTRLRLRAERSQQPELRAAMIGDIGSVSAMVEDALTYLSKDVTAEKQVKVDVPSVLHTVVSDFTDMGFSVAYEGSERSVYICKPRSLTRAVTNLVENSTKHGSSVIVRMSPAPDGSLLIEVEDDGPGLPSSLHEQVLQPFFKADTARTADAGAGFGLGLSIVNDIVRGHGGTLTLHDREAGGLVARIDLPPQASTAIKAPPDAPRAAFGDRAALTDG